ncbi:N-acetyl-gamma-glutamyl-phosphate reductase [Sulfurospirillum multivorans]|uniref:N-acetyl-gamma-glutamyl-phosphate reductase n=2 Tax=Sulfurospirillum multivorans TaxID=66821 RepID=A0AA86DYD9_SULMK|nr:N-acetyl-gamma-glutamyl-phosphate reductase [Sulfurospirillum multivorans]AHJ11560.1 N-acetyl-gamma-glutamyl-phosphate reductase [Sulfurospirillum multivorans DSM 12446]QEH05061.1 N-acetyl-gamma-glutamyl-phosphate reductase [Sulfurospirillum multivorans]
MAKIDVAIIGASGYTGLELIKILINHPHFNISYIATTEGGIKASELHPSLLGVFEQEVLKADASVVAKHAKLAFLALPHKAAMGFAKELLGLHVKVVDLSADYRLELEAYEKHYCEHEDKEHLKEAIYGLPEINRAKIKEANLIANPGCYPTASILGILPFLSYLKKDAPIFIDAKSGVSGAGKKPSATAHFVTINENIFAYNPLKHRHEPEISEKLRLVSGHPFEVNFVPHLLPVSRGMLVSSYLQTNEVIDAKAILQDFYKNERFVRIREVPVDIKSTAGTNFCDIFVSQKGKSIFVSSSIDNLLRGASAQAVVNANLMCGFEESAGIPIIAYVP